MKSQLAKKTNLLVSKKALVVLSLAVAVVVSLIDLKKAEVEKKVVSESPQVHAVEKQATEKIANIETTFQTLEKSETIKADDIEFRGPIPIIRDEDVFEIVDIPPHFTAGKKALEDYISANTRYPKELEKDSIQGRVVVQFIVTRTGDIIGAKVVWPLHPLLDAEALRIINGMPKWTPGIQNGKIVNVKCFKSVSFRIKNAPPIDEMLSCKIKVGMSS